MIDGNIMNYLIAFFAGMVQGLSEFLPISSTGHLIIFEKIFNLSPDSFGLAFDASLHLGTLLAVLAYFYKDYIRALKSKKLLLGLILGTGPAVIFGLLLEDFIARDFRQLWIVGMSLIAFSFVMLLAEKVRKRQNTIGGFGVGNAIIVGFAQALALIPGISRSGSTISAGLFLNFKREDAAKFAFMLSGPIIAGAGLKKFLDVLKNPTGSQVDYFLIGILSSAVFGYLTIKYFLAYLNKRGLMPFIYYRIILGAILVALSMFAPANL